MFDTLSPLAPRLRLQLKLLTYAYLPLNVNMDTNGAYKMRKGFERDKTQYSVITGVKTGRFPLQPSFKLAYLTAHPSRNLSFS